MQNEDILHFLPELPDTYFWRIGKSGSGNAVITNDNQVISSSNCVFLTIRRNKKFMKFRFSVPIETKNLIYVGEDLDRLKQEVLIMHNTFCKKLDRVSGVTEEDFVLLYVGDYQRSQNGNSAFGIFGDLSFLVKNSK